MLSFIIVWFEVPKGTTGLANQSHPLPPDQELVEPWQSMVAKCC